MSNPTWLWAIVNGTTYDLTGAGILIPELVDGLGLPPLHRFTQRGPQQHGATNRDFRLDPRSLTLIGSFTRNCPADVWAARRRLLDIFKPSNIPVQLRWDLSDGTSRQLDTFIEGELTLPFGAVSGQGGGQDRQTLIGLSGGVQQRTAIQVIAEDPTLYDPTLVTVTIPNTTFGTGMTVPLPVPFSIGSSVMSGAQVITYLGDWLTYPTIRLTGPMTDPIVTNTTTGEVLNFTGTTIAIGEYLDIDLSYGAKTVRDSNGVNQIAALVSTSDLGTWHLAAGSDASSSLANTITITASATSSVSAVRLTFYTRYLGI